MKKILRRAKKPAKKKVSSAVIAATFLGMVAFLVIASIAMRIFGWHWQEGVVQGVSTTTSSVSGCQIPDGPLATEGQSWYKDRCNYCLCTGGSFHCAKAILCPPYPFPTLPPPIITPVPTNPSSFKCGSPYTIENGMTYGTVVVGNTCWMTKNLNEGTFGKTKYCYSDKESNCASYGGLYTYAQAQSACPVGWRLPTNAEWSAVNTSSGIKNISYNYFGQYYNNTYMHMNEYGLYWSTGTYDSYYKKPTDSLAFPYTGSVAQNRRLSVRCVIANGTLVLTPTPTSSSLSCKWCGASCVRSDKYPDTCLGIMPPSGYSCVFGANNECVQVKDVTTPTPTPTLFISPTPNPLTPPKINYSCNKDTDCVIKDVGNCCGYYPKCVNRDSTPNREFVRNQCQKDGMMSACGFPSLDDCKCINNKCAGVFQGKVNEMNSVIPTPTLMKELTWEEQQKMNRPTPTPTPGSTCPSTNGATSLNSIYLTGAPTTVSVSGYTGTIVSWEYYQNGTWHWWGGTEGKTSITWVATPCVGCKFRAKIQNNTCIAYSTETSALIKK